MIDERKIRTIEYLVEGSKTKQEIAKLVGISDRQLYRWLSEDEFISEWHKRTEQSKTIAHKAFDSKLNIALDKLWEIINSDVDVRTREKALEYWINRSLGTPTNKIETNDTSKENKITSKDLQSILNEIEEDDNTESTEE